MNARAMIAALAVLIGAFTGAAAAQIPCQYEVAQIFQGPDCGIFGNSPTVARAISPNGQYVCGYYSPCGGSVHQSFYWTQTSGMVDIPMPANTTSLTALDVNDAGQVCGGCDGGTFSSRGFIYTIATGQFRFVQSLAAGPCHINAINNAGVSCGVRTFDTQQNLYSSFIRAPDGAITDLGVINGPRSAATDIAEDGTVVGWTGNGGFTFGDVGFVHDGGTISLLPPVGPGGTSRPVAINNSHVIIGSGRIPQGQPLFITRAFVYSNDAMQLIEPLPDFRDSGALGLSDSGVVSGVCNVLLSGSPPDGLFLWQAGITTPLAGRIVAPSGLDVDDIGEIASNGWVLGNGAINGQSVGLILVPSPDSLGDVDHNCRTDIDDLVDVIVDWGKTKSPADLNGDLTVDVLDLVIVIENWSA